MFESEQNPLHNHNNQTPRNSSYLSTFLQQRQSLQNPQRDFMKESMKEGFQIMDLVQKRKGNQKIINELKQKIKRFDQRIQNDPSYQLKENESDWIDNAKTKKVSPRFNQQHINEFKSGYQQLNPKFEQDAQTLERREMLKHFNDDNDNLQRSSSKQVSSPKKKKIQSDQLQRQKLLQQQLLANQSNQKYEALQYRYAKSKAGANSSHDYQQIWQSNLEKAKQKYGNEIQNVNKLTINPQIQNFIGKPHNQIEEVNKLTISPEKEQMMESSEKLQNTINERLENIKQKYYQTSPKEKRVTFQEAEYPVSKELERQNYQKQKQALFQSQVNQRMNVENTNENEDEEEEEEEKRLVNPFTHLYQDEDELISNRLNELQLKQSQQNEDQIIQAGLKQLNLKLNLNKVDQDYQRRCQLNPFIDLNKEEDYEAALSTRNRKSRFYNYDRFYQTALQKSKLKEKIEKYKNSSDLYDNNGFFSQKPNETSNEFLTQKYSETKNRAEYFKQLTTPKHNIPEFDDFINDQKFSEDQKLQHEINKLRLYYRFSYFQLIQIRKFEIKNQN